MKFTIKESTTEELQQELDRNLMDLFGDVLLLKSLICYISQHEYLPSTMNICLRRVGDYIEQHTNEVKQLSHILIKSL